MTHDTIFALATPPGRSGVAVVRISGPNAASMLESLTGRNLPEARKASLRRLRDTKSRLIDEALILWFPGPASFTGEDSVELQLHGGPAVIDGALEALSDLGGRPAEAGEFTRRAFENGRLDLTEAEGLADLIEAETRGQREQALAQMSGSLRQLYEGWRAQLISIMAAIEGEIDFPDEEGVPDALAETAGTGISSLLAEIKDHLDDDQRGEKIRKGFDIAIIGRPNAGKSSLLNALSKREAAIVTDIPGTTRDIVEVRLELGGFVVTLADTAGIRDAQDIVEKEGVRRALTRADSADLVVAVLDGSEAWSENLTPIVRAADVIVINKADSRVKLTRPDSDVPVFSLSALSGEGLEAFNDYLTRTVVSALGSREAPALTRLRHRRHVEAASGALMRSLDQLHQPELAGEDLRLAVRALESLTGRVDVEDVLGEIFSRFCVGK